VKIHSCQQQESSPRRSGRFGGSIAGRSPLPDDEVTSQNEDGQRVDQGSEGDEGRKLALDIGVGEEHLAHDLAVQSFVLWRGRAHHRALSTNQSGQQRAAEKTDDHGNQE
jgi:hypothetical protein